MSFSLSQNNEWLFIICFTGLCPHTLAGCTLLTTCILSIISGLSSSHTLSSSCADCSLNTFVFSLLSSVQCLVLIAQSCSTLCDSMDCGLPGFSVHGILQARILDWVAIFFSRWPSPLRDQTHVSRTAGRGFKIWATREAWYSLPLQMFPLSEKSLPSLLSGKLLFITEAQLKYHYLVVFSHLSQNWYLSHFFFCTNIFIYS